jgi:methylase of polypeptide subunit release factors
LADDDIARLRDALAEADYTVDGVRELLGARAAAALERNETTPGRAATEGDAPLAVLTRLWPLQFPVPRAAVERILPLPTLLDGGFVEVDGDEVTARVDVRPYADEAGDWWVVADLTPGLDGSRALIPDDHVLGVNAASSTLAQLTVRRPVDRALDLGTGCGVQALHLARHCTEIVATDVNRRALAMASITARLNGLDVDLREGSLFEPVAGERFDLIATNPPFVVSPGGQHVYRDSGLAGDEVSRRVVTEGARRLADGGMLQSLANWMQVRGSDWRERVGGWIEGTGCDAWVIQREVQDPAEYVELWLRDSGEIGRPGYAEKYAAWLAWFDANDVDGVGFGWIALRAAGRRDPVVRLEEWPHAVEQPLGPDVGARFDRAELLRADERELLARRWVVAPGVVQEQIGRPGDEDPEHLVIRQRHGLMRAVEVGTAQAGLVGACEGSLPLGAIIAALAELLAVDADALRADLMPRVREFVADGFLLPA